MKQFIYYMLLGCMVVSQSCDSYLDVKPRSNLVVPETLEDMEQLLDNGTATSPYPELLEIQADDFYLEHMYWNSMSDPVNKNAYVWEKDVYGTTESHSAWSQPYIRIFYANAVLDGLKDIGRTEYNAARYDQVKGTALFLKAEAVYILSQLFAKVYDVRTAEGDMGIPIPMSANVNEKVSRPSVAYTFDFITSSLSEAEKLLGTTIDFSRPSKAAANALLARVYLYMGNYEKALIHSDISLDFFEDIADLNNVSIRDYKHTLLLRIITPSTQIRNRSASTFMDTVLMESYSPSDRRLSLFYMQSAPKKWIKQRYHNLVNLCFAGLDADEQLLIRAECYARDGQVGLALADLNHLLEHRFETGSYVPYMSTDKDEILDWVLTERRKELVFRGIRWSDLKRMNREGYDITLTRNLSVHTYVLQSNSNRWVLPIPINEINLSNIPQNER